MGRGQGRESVGCRMTSENKVLVTLGTLDMLHAIEDAKCIYDIHYCRAGVGFLFYEGPPLDGPTPEAAWRKYLAVDRYYPSFEEAVAAEYARLVEL